MIKKVLKKLIPNKVIQLIHVGKDIGYYQKVINEIGKNNEIDNIYIFGSAIHTNLGDHLITMAEIDFLKDIYPSKKIVEIPTEVYQIYKEKLINCVSDKALIIINGGGWMGNVWVKEELIVQDIVSSFYKNRIIIFPQTIFYKKDIKPYRELIDSAKKSFEKCPRLVLSVRDQQSYDFAKKEFTNTKTLLVPDIALYCNGKISYNNENRTKRVLYCLRDDRELIRSNGVLEKIDELLKKKGYISGNISTMNNKRVSEKQRREIVNDRLMEFSKAQLVVTDRLHGMIFAFIVGVPCLIMDNSTKKVSGVYNKWLKESNLVYPLYENDAVEDLTKFLDSVDKTNNKNYPINFDELKEEIVNG